MSSCFHEISKIGPRVTALPVVHGSGDFAWAVRNAMLAGSFDCLAVPVPPSFSGCLESAILELPTPGVVTQLERQWSSPQDEDSDADPAASFVPVDPCQPVIAALRTAMGERMPRRFIDLETADY
ncbi:MAG: hypothetical protein GY883_22040, partial [Shimia sp.]|nr:hypothetical protein [Shimia sp.]